jgi:FtsP/CotA-like multicopper oxidase with cupredoxin domain
MQQRGPWTTLIAAVVVLTGAAAGFLPGIAAADPRDGADSRAKPVVLEAHELRDLPNPPEIRSRRGVLRATFVAEPGRVTVAGRTFRSNVYNGLYVPPTLRVRRGDKVRLRVVNRIGPADVAITGPQITNIHFHGMDVTPKPPGDSVFIRIRPQKSFSYRFDIPDNHPRGLHWYHSHLHGSVDPQILSGQSGMLIVDGGIESHYPELASLRRRVMVLKDINLPGASSPTKTLNGFANPPIKARAGELQLWQIGNLGADGFFDLALEGHAFWVLERDGNFLSRPVRQKNLFLPPGARTLVVVRAGAAGRYQLRSRAVFTGPTGLPNPEVRLGTLVVDGPDGALAGGGPAQQATALAARLEQPAARLERITLTAEQVKRMPITRRRTFTFSDAPDFSAFFINGRTYKEDRIDTTVRLGEVEEWTVRNVSGELHVFHLHQTAFLVTESSDPQQDYLGLRDVINVPYQTGGKPGEVKLIVPFINPVMLGTFVYHCHIVGHEDAGMMANIQVLPRRTAGEAAWDWLRRLASLDLPVPWRSAAASSSESGGPPVFPFDDPNAICRSSFDDQAGRQQAAAR